MLSLETIQMGVDTTIIGLGIVFMVLVALAIITWLLSAIVDGSVKYREARKAESLIVPTVYSETVENKPKLKPELLSAVINPTITPQTVAAIMAAVSMASGQPLSHLRFSAIRRGTTNSSGWASSSTLDIIASRQAYL